RPSSFHSTGGPQRNQSKQKATGRYHHHDAKGCRAFPQNRSPGPTHLLHARRNQNPERRQRLSGLCPQDLFPLESMDYLLYWLARGIVSLLQSLPLPVVARLGRAGGALAYWLDARHRRVALSNLTLAFPGEKSAAEIRSIARENFRRIGENYVC